MIAVALGAVLLVLEFRVSPPVRRHADFRVPPQDSATPSVPLAAVPNDTQHS